MKVRHSLFGPYGVILILFAIASQLAFAAVDRFDFYLDEQKSPAMSLSSGDIQSIEVHQNEVGIATLNMRLSDQAGKKFEELTGANFGKKLSIVFDGKVLMSPVIKGKIARDMEISLSPGSTDHFWENVPWLRARIVDQRHSEVSTHNRNLAIYLVCSALVLGGALWFGFGGRRKAQSSI